MTFSSLWEAISLWAMHAGMPLVHVYHIVCADPFLSVSASDACGLEKWGNRALVPLHYLTAAQTAHRHTDPLLETDIYYLEQTFDYKDPWMWHKTALSYIALPASVMVGSVAKAMSYLSLDTRQRHHLILSSKKHTPFISNDQYYRQIGIEPPNLDVQDLSDFAHHKRRPGEEDLLPYDKEALRHVVKILFAHKIMFWADCGTCLGVFRYGGLIPWDWDIDIAILQKDFDNVKNVLEAGLDPQLYTIQDWSSRDKPKTYLKVYVRKTGLLIDIYNFAIDEQRKEISSILSNGDCVFLPHSWKIRERRFTIASSFDTVFPLKKAVFDGIEVLVPSKTKEYLQQRYGENIGPAKVYNELTGQYEKDLSHPYWQRPYVH